MTLSPPNAAEDEVPLVPLLDPKHGGQLRSLVRTATLLITGFGAALFHLDPIVIAYILSALTAADLVVTQLTYKTKLGNATPAPEAEVADEPWKIVDPDQLVLTLYTTPPPLPDGMVNTGYAITGAGLYPDQEIIPGPGSMFH